MKINVNDTEYILDDLITHNRKLISVGRKCDEVCNTIAIDDDSFDVFQCQISRNEAGEWLIHNGQYRTECPRGLRSPRDKACSSCMSVCVSISVANPTYSWRTPKKVTLLNGTSFEGYAPLHDCDRITVYSND